MKVVICGSHSMDKEMADCAIYFKEMLPGIENEIITPFTEDISLVVKMERYVSHIATADLVVIIPKAFSPEMNIGESTTYELAMARFFKKQIVYWEV